MSQADVLSLVASLSNGQADQTLAATFYTDAVNELADKEFLTTTALAGFTENTELLMPLELRRLMGVVYNDVQIDEMTLRQLEHLDSRWRERSGKPRGFTMETETAKTIALYPTPDVASAAYSGSAPVLGLGYPQFNGVLFYSGYRDPIPQQLELIVVFWILGREYSRESDHQNAAMAAFCQNMVDILYEVFGY